MRGGSLVPSALLDDGGDVLGLDAVELQAQPVRRLDRGPRLCGTLYRPGHLVVHCQAPGCRYEPGV